MDAFVKITFKFIFEAYFLHPLRNTRQQNFGQVLSLGPNAVSLTWRVDSEKNSLAEKYWEASLN